jgi:hypothetical protein
MRKRNWFLSVKKAKELEKLAKKPTILRHRTGIRESKSAGPWASTRGYMTGERERSAFLSTLDFST